MFEAWKQAKEFKESQKWDENVRVNALEGLCDAKLYEHPVEVALKKQNEQGRFVQGEFIVNSYRLGVKKHPYAFEMLDLYGMEVSDLSYARRMYGKDILKYQEFPYPSGEKIWTTSSSKIRKGVLSFVKKHRLGLMQNQGQDRVVGPHNDEFDLIGWHGQRVALIESTSFYAATPELFESLGKEVYGLISDPRLMLKHKSG